MCPFIGYDGFRLTTGTIQILQECLTDMFDWWLNNSDDTTYESLACGIRDIGETKVVTCFLQQPSHSEEVYSKLAHALNRIRGRDSDGESKHRQVIFRAQFSNR